MSSDIDLDPLVKVMTLNYIVSDLMEVCSGRRNMTMMMGSSAVNFRFEYCLKSILMLSGASFSTKLEESVAGFFIISWQIVVE